MKTIYIRNCCIFLCLFLIASMVFGQQEKFSYKMLADSFQINYNTDNFDAIFLSFSPEMKKALPLEKTKDFLTELKKQSGRITERKFTRYEQTYASYKTHFERALFAVNISIDNNQKINGLFIKPYKDKDLPKLDRNRTKLILPFNGEWTVVWGGDTKELNYHIENEAQKNAFDFIITNEDGNSYKTDGKINSDYYAFGKELFAPCDAEVVMVVDGIKDNSPGTLNSIYIPGNTVILKTSNNEYLFFAHFKQHSILVIEGQKVKQGQTIGLCGNSGNSSEPHLHFHIQNVEDINIATGVKCYFEQIIANSQDKTDYSPIRKDKIMNRRIY